MALWNIQGNFLEIAKQMSNHSRDVIYHCNLGWVDASQYGHN